MHLSEIKTVIICRPVAGDVWIAGLVLTALVAACVLVRL